MNKLKLIDFLLMFTGKVNRHQLMEVADIAIATASRALTEYREMYPENISYNISKKCYEITNGFKPIYSHDVESSLRTVAYGKRIEPTIMKKTIGPSHTNTPQSDIKLDIAASITSAIFNKCSLNINYVSSSSNELVNSQRDIYPVAIFESKNKWYLRAFNFKDNKYKNFKLIRIQSVERIDKTSPSIPDKEWYESVTLTIGPHRNHPYPNALKKDLGLTNKPVLNLKTTSVLAGFLLAEWGVDSSKNAGLDPYYFQYELLNRHELENIGSMNIAPGFTLPKK